MKDELLSFEFANEVYAILMDIGGANESMYDSFIHHHCTNPDGCGEWRFGGRLGHGGKYFSGMNKVCFYSEDTNEKRDKLRSKINEELSKLKK